MVYCNLCVEMGFHFDEMFEAQLRFTYPSHKDKHLSTVEVPDDPSSKPSPSHSSSSEYWRNRRKRGYRHHASYENLLRSAALGCELCKLFILHPWETLYAVAIKGEEGLPDEEKQIYVSTKL